MYCRDDGNQTEKTESGGTKGKRKVTDSLQEEKGRMKTVQDLNQGKNAALIIPNNEESKE